MPDTKPTEWIDLSKEEIIKRKDAVIDQLTKQIEEMDKDAKDKARSVVKELIRYQKDEWVHLFHSPKDALETAKDVVKEAFGIEEKKSEEDNSNGKDANEKR